MKDPVKNRGVRVEEAATIEEVVAAIQGLGEADWARLRSYARFRMNGVPRAQHRGRSYEDLLREAVSRGVTGDRRWRQDIPFIRFLLGAVKSISTSWKTQANPDLAISESEFPLVGSGEVLDPWELVATETPDPGRYTEAREILRIIKEHFEEDALVSLVIDGLGDGLELTEIAQLLDVDQKSVEAALKKLRRHVRAIFPEWRAP